MSDAHSTQHDSVHDVPHEGPIKTPKQLVVAVVASFVIPIVLIILIATFVAVGTKPGAGSGEFTPEAVARRLQPVGTVDVADAAAAGGAQALRAGEQVYAAACGACDPGNGRRSRRGGSGVFGSTRSSMPGHSPVARQV